MPLGKRQLLGRGNTAEDFRPGTQTRALEEEKSVVEKLQENTCGGRLSGRSSIRAEASFGSSLCYEDLLKRSESS